LLDTLVKSLRAHLGDKVSTRFEEKKKPAIPFRAPATPKEDVATPDGRVTRADVDHGYAYIDLGRVDGVRVGQRFKVYTVRKGGWRKPKGEGRIIRVEKDFSQCSILSLTDADDPIAMGDTIWNKQFKPPSLPHDGRVTRADVDPGYVTIDLGSKDGVRTGLRFKVFAVFDEGYRQLRGEVRVIRVEKDFSQCAILTEIDPVHPIAMGDYVWNEFFVAGKAKFSRPGMKLVFVFIGEFGEGRTNHTRRQLEKIIQSAGHVVGYMITGDVHYAVLGENYEKDPDYQSIRGRRIVTIGPRDLFDYFGFGKFK
ncbi:MAG: hypothetical protein ACYTHM_25345, partial [Planctomycetota bacterium]